MKNEMERKRIERHSNEQNLRDMYNEKSGSLDEDEDDVDVDLGSLAFHIWKNATDANPDLNNSKGEIVSQSQKRILQALACPINEPSVEPHENHLELVDKAVKGIKNENTNVGGILGSRFSTKRKIYDLLNHYYEKPLDLFYTQDKKALLKFAIDQIYNYPLLENSKFIIGRMMRSNTTSHDDIVDTIIEMYENGNLCRIDEDKNKHKDPTIICSMGLKAE